MSEDNKDFDPNSSGSRKKKVEEFKLDISAGEEKSFLPEGLKEENVDINSFSDELRDQQIQDAEPTNADRVRMKEKSKSNRWTFRMVWISLIVILSIIFAKYILIGVNDMLAINQPDEVVTITVPKGASVGKIADILVQSGTISNKEFFKFYVTVTKARKNFVPGTFELRKNMDYQAIISHIKRKSNRTDVVDILFIEGMNLMQYASKLEENNICSANEFLEVCNSDMFDDKYGFLSSMPNKGDRYYKLEGYTFPDTYKFYLNEDAEDVVQKMLANYNKKVTTKYEVYGYDSKISIEEMAKKAGKDMHQILTIASIIQAEAADEDDMFKVSSVIYNRLSTLKTSGMNKNKEYGLNKLHMDSTVWYPYKSRSDVPSEKVNSFSSKYDTYKIIGLPAGPICNPGRAALEAAINPSSTDYYYFCHSSKGKAYYAKTLAQHQKNLVAAGLA